jgi:hypothetical protein
MPVVKPAKTFSLLTSVDVNHGTPIPDQGCRDTCVFDAATEWHHRRLMTIESDQDVVLELIEVAVTWPELEYSETPTIAPEHWTTFVENHHWADQDRVERIFSLATDIAWNAMRASRQRPRVSDRHFGQVGGANRVAEPPMPVEQRHEVDPKTSAVDIGGGIGTPRSGSPRPPLCVSVGEP